jgi:hypothetical protein
VEGHAYMDRMAVPQPTSRTTLSLKMCLFWTMAFMYDLVRTSSFCRKGCVSLLSGGASTACRATLSIAGEGEQTHQHLLVDAFTGRKVSDGSCKVPQSCSVRTMMIVAVGATGQQQENSISRALARVGATLPLEVVLLAVLHRVHLLLGGLDVHLVAAHFDGFLDLKLGTNRKK